MAAPMVEKMASPSVAPKDGMKDVSLVVVWVERKAEWVNWTERMKVVQLVAVMAEVTVVSSVDK